MSSLSRSFKRGMFFALCLVFLFSGARAHAQYGVYASFSTTDFESTNAPRIYGGTVGLYSEKSIAPLVKFGFDVRGVINHGSNADLQGGYGGARIAVHPILPLNVYVEGLVGGAHAAFNGADTTAFSYQALGGVDLTIAPRIDWRVVEFTYTGIPTFDALNGNPQTLATGIVLRLPRIF